jgi:hypothetical protein
LWRQLCATRDLSPMRRVAVNLGDQSRSVLGILRIQFHRRHMKVADGDLCR